MVIFYSKLLVYQMVMNLFNSSIFWPFQPARPLPGPPLAHRKCDNSSGDRFRTCLTVGAGEFPGFLSREHVFKTNKAESV